MNSLKQVKLRIAVAVDEGGSWYAIGGSEWTDKEAIQEALANVHDGDMTTTYFVESFVRVPEPIVVSGEAAQSPAEERLEAARRNFEERIVELDRLKAIYDDLIKRG